MPLIFNGTEVDSVYFNGTEIDNLIHNGVEVFSSTEVAPWMSFVQTSRETDNPTSSRSFMYRLNYDTVTPTEIYSTPSGTVISSVVRDPNTGAYYLVERDIVNQPIINFRFRIKKSTNGLPPWNTQLEVVAGSTDVALGRLIVRGSNEIDFIYPSTIGPTTMRCYTTTNGTSWSVKWTSPGISSELPRVVTRAAFDDQTLVVLNEDGAAPKARILASNGTIANTLTDTAEFRYYMGSYCHRHGRIYFSRERIATSTMQLMSTNITLGDLQSHDSGGYVSAAATFSEEGDFYYGNDNNMRSFNQSTVSHRYTVGWPIWTTLARGRYILSGSVNQSPPRVLVSFNRGQNWFQINLPNPTPELPFNDVGSLVY